MTRDKYRTNLDIALWNIENEGLLPYYLEPATRKLVEEAVKKITKID